MINVPMIGQDPWALLRDVYEVGEELVRLKHPGKYESDTVTYSIWRVFWDKYPQFSSYYAITKLWDSYKIENISAHMCQSWINEKLSLRDVELEYEKYPSKAEDES